jgi:hypothetical protein
VLRVSGRAYALQHKYAIHNRHGSAQMDCKFSVGIRSRALDSRIRKKVYSLLASACGSSPSPVCLQKAWQSMTEPKSVQTMRSNAHPCRQQNTPTAVSYDVLKG